jgi:hypothetical protein
MSVSACTNSLGLPLAVDSFCQVGAGSYPILLSRKDTLETKRAVSKLNLTYERLCKVENSNAPEK